MSCKVLREEPGAVQRVVWRPAGEERAIRVPPPAKGAAGEPDAAAYQARAAELEKLLEARVSEARQAGLREGEAAGRKQAAAEMEQALNRMAASAADLGRYRSQLMAQAERDVLKLALAIARRILHRELTVDPDAIAAIVKAALEKIGSQEPSRVRVHPEQAEPLRNCLTRLGSSMEVSPDASLDRGGLIFEAGCGYLDASIGAQLQEIETGLSDRLQN